MERFLWSEQLCDVSLCKVKGRPRWKQQSWTSFRSLWWLMTGWVTRGDRKGPGGDLDHTGAYTAQDKWWQLNNNASTQPCSQWKSSVLMYRFSAGHLIRWWTPSSPMTVTVIISNYGWFRIFLLLIHNGPSGTFMYVGSVDGVVTTYAYQFYTLSFKWALF